jgi:hypothetical protein
VDTTCGERRQDPSAPLDVAVHGPHIVGDYVTGEGRANTDWPPKGGVVGQAIAGEGVAIAGGPGPGFHFLEGFAPGASLCLSQSQSPGDHLGHRAPARSEDSGHLLRPRLPLAASELGPLGAAVW